MAKRVSRKDIEEVAEWVTEEFQNNFKLKIPEGCEKAKLDHLYKTKWNQKSRTNRKGKVRIDFVFATSRAL